MSYILSTVKTKLSPPSNGPYSVPFLIIFLFNNFFNNKPFQGFLQTIFLELHDKTFILGTQTLKFKPFPIS